MNTSDLLLLLHPLLAVTVVLPTIGIIVRMAVQTRQRRLKALNGEKNGYSCYCWERSCRDRAVAEWLSGSVISNWTSPPDLFHIYRTSDLDDGTLSSHICGDDICSNEFFAVLALQIQTKTLARDICYAHRDGVNHPRLPARDLSPRI